VVKYFVWIALDCVRPVLFPIYTGADTERHLIQNLDCLAVWQLCYCWLLYAIVDVLFTVGVVAGSNVRAETIGQTWRDPAATHAWAGSKESSLLHQSQLQWGLSMAEISAWQSDYTELWQSIVLLHNPSTESFTAIITVNYASRTGPTNNVFIFSTAF